MASHTATAEYQRLIEQLARQMQRDAVTRGMVTYNHSFDDRTAVINKMAIERAERIPEYENRMRAKMIEAQSALPDPEPNKVLLLL